MKISDKEAFQRAKKRIALVLGILVVLYILFLPFPGRVHWSMQGMSLSANGEVESDTVDVTIKGWYLDYLFRTDQMDVTVSISPFAGDNNRVEEYDCQKAIVSRQDGIISFSGWAYNSQRNELISGPIYLSEDYSYFLLDDRAECGFCMWPVPAATRPFRMLMIFFKDTSTLINNSKPSSGQKPDEGLFSDRPDDAAGNLGPGIPGGLGGEVVRACVDDDYLPQDLPHGKPVGEKGAPCPSVIAKQGQQVSGVLRVRDAAGVIMGSGVCKGIRLVSGATASAVDVHGENGSGAGSCSHRQPTEAGHHINS